MPPPPDVNIGPLTRRVLRDCVWSGDSIFPAFQCWADEVERVLSFLEEQDVFDRFIPRLRSRNYQGILAEARAGYYCHRNGFRISKWEPPAVGRHLGDFEIQKENLPPILIEVKGPTWESELSDEEKLGDRRGRPKYINAEARLIGPIQPVLYAVEKSLPKLASHRPNIIIVVDDLFVSPIEIPMDYLIEIVKAGIAGDEYRSVSAVLLINPICRDYPVVYRRCLIINQKAAVELSVAVREALTMPNPDPAGPQW